jgi:dipeptidyl-peptidase-4
VACLSEARRHGDLKRVGIVGHSYGGYLAAFALTHSKMFKMAIAGSALTDWRNYDSVYAERLLQMPDKNPEGYKRASAVEAAGNLHGRLLLAHGVMDDNVHLTNIMQFIQAAEDADKDFELMLYPTAGHGVGGTHWDNLQNEFIKQNL